MSKQFNRRGVVKEFLGRIVKSIGRKKGSAAAKQMMKSPEIKKLVQKSKDLADEFEMKMRQKAKENPEVWQSILDDYLKDKKG